MGFLHLNVPDQWNQYYTKYPEGYTILESLLNWVQQVNDMTDNMNAYDLKVDDFIAQFDTELQSTVEKTLTDWQNSGFLNIVINDALQTQIDTVQAVTDLFKETYVFITDSRFGAKGDGATDDTAAIQAAIDYVYNRGGGVVVVPFSQNPFIFTSICVKTKVTLKGMGGTLKLKDATCTNTSTNYYLVHNINYDNGTFDSLIIDGNQSNNQYYLVADAITAGGKNTVVVNCTIKNAPDSGIMFSNAEKGRCQNNRITNCRDLGIYVNALSPSTINEAIVSGNIIEQCTYGGIGIKRQAANIVVANNTIQNCGNGITVEDFTSSGMGYPTQLQIIGNEIKDIGYAFRGAANLAEVGISISKTDFSIITGNKVYNCSGICLNIGTITNSLIAHNVLEGYTANPITGATYNNSGIVVTNATDSAIINNLVKNVNDYGAYLAATNGGRFSGNDLTAGATLMGLRINASCLNTLVLDNNIKGGSSGDTAFYAGHTCIIKNNLYKSSSAGSASYYGFRTIASGQPAPNVGTVVPYFVGEDILYLQDNTWWRAYGTAAGNWSKLSN